MPGSASYGKRLLQRTWKETAAFWTVYRYWATVAPALVAILSLAYRRGWASLMNAGDVLVNAGAGLAVTLAGTIVISFIRSLKLLDDDWRTQVARRESTIIGLQAQVDRPGRIDRELETRLRSEISNLTEDCRKLLVFLIQFGGEIERWHLSRGCGLDQNAFDQALSKLIYANLVRVRHEWAGTTVRGIYMSIPEGYMDALRRVFSVG